jgi:hypothetical protein
MTWVTAHALCEQEGTHLAVVKTKQKAQDMVDALNNAGKG